VHARPRCAATLAPMERFKGILENVDETVAQFRCSDGSRTGRVIRARVTREQHGKLLDAYVRNQNLVEGAVDRDGALLDDFTCTG